MVGKVIKYGAIGTGGACLLGLLVFGGDLFSYVSSSVNSARSAVKESVPIDFELRRAHDLLENVIPEMQANVRLIAQEEVEVANLKQDIQQSDLALAAERGRIEKLSGMLNVEQASYTFGERKYSRDDVKDDLARRFDRFKEAQQIQDGKRHLLTSREKSLSAAMQQLDKTRSQKVVLEDKIAALEAQHRLVKAASAGSQFKVDNSKLAQTDKLISDIKKRLDVAERVLSHEARFVQPIEVDTVSEKDLLSQVNEYFTKDASVAGQQTATAPAR